MSFKLLKSVLFTHLNVLPAVVHVGDHSVAQQRGEEDACGDAQLVQGGDNATGLGSGDLAQQHGGNSTGNAHTEAWKNMTKVRDKCQIQSSAIQKDEKPGEHR